MLAEKIGENAGNIWSSLKDNGPMTASALKKSTKLNDKDLFMSLGWLARDGKLNFERRGNQFKVNLTE